MGLITIVCVVVSNSTDSPLLINGQDEASNASMVLHYKLYNASIILFLNCFVFVASIPSKELNGKVHGYLFPLQPHPLGRKKTNKPQALCGAEIVQLKSSTDSLSFSHNEMTVQACFYKSDAVIYLNVAIIVLSEDKERERSQHYFSF